MQPGHAEKRTHDYVRHGTTTLFAALEIATGQVTVLCKPRHRHQEFLVFLRHLARAYPDQQLHLIMDNYAAHKHPKVKAWLAANPRIHLHFTPTSGSWLNLVEVWLSIIERQAIHRGTFASVHDLMIKIRTFINGWNDRRQPFTWTKTAEQILTKANRQTTSDSVHQEYVLCCLSHRSFRCRPRPRSHDASSSHADRPSHVCGAEGSAAPTKGPHRRHGHAWTAAPAECVREQLHQRVHPAVLAGPDRA